MQTRLTSLIEIVANISTGFVVSWLVTIYLLPMYGLTVTISQSRDITLIYTVISIARSYVWRRIFNRLLIKKLLAKDANWGSTLYCQEAPVELLPCVKCGSQGEIIPPYEDDGEVRCVSCGHSVVCVGINNSYAEEGAIKLWNQESR